MTKQFYIVMVIEHPCVTIDGRAARPKLIDGVAGYAPIYFNKRKARKDWPKAEIKTLEKIC